MSKDKILILGENGQLAKALARQPEVRTYQSKFLGRAALDLASSDTQIRKTLARHECNLIVNTAAYTQVDQAEDAPDLAYSINGRALAAISAHCTQAGIPLIHISTDYVFDGTKRAPYHPTDATNPIGVYGASKLAGEQACVDSGCFGAILRTSWVYDGFGKNFFTTISTLANERDDFQIVCDQIGRPTLSDHLASAILKLVRHLLRRPDTPMAIYHVSGTGPATSWDAFARVFLSAQYGDVKTVHPISSSAYPTKARRPAYSVLETADFEKTFAHPLPDWRDGLETALKQWQKR